MSFKDPKFTRIYFEPAVKEFPLGKYLFKKYEGLPKTEVASHNNIEVLRKYENKDFTKLKRYLILGTRKTHKYSENHKISDYLVPFTSSGCYAMCLYCYLVCNYNKCSYLRVFVNTQEILDRLVKKANEAETSLTFEIGSNSDLLLENLVTNQLEENIEYFLKHAKKGRLTFPTKFDAIEPLYHISDKQRVLPRMSLNPQEIITKVELGTSHLQERLTAINTLSHLGYDTYILIAPVIITDNFEDYYGNLIDEMDKTLTKAAKANITFEIIFMTYSYVHRKINEEAFPKAQNLYSPTLMTGRGMGKYHYKDPVKEQAKIFLQERLTNTFPDCTILYIV